MGGMKRLLKYNFIYFQERIYYTVSFTISSLQCAFYEGLRNMSINAKDCKWLQWLQYDCKALQKCKNDCTVWSNSDSTF